MKPLVLTMPGNETVAARLAEATGSELGKMVLRAFPDGETYLRLNDSPKGRTITLVCTLAHPNDKILPLIFAADTLRELGAARVGLVAPYLAYMRQDRRFHSGEAITSHSFASLISRSFDWLVTIDPHLHRYKSLDEIYTIPCHALHAGPAIAKWIEENIRHPFIIGPDGESRQWVAAVAAACGAKYDVFQKSRLADRSVSIEGPHLRISPGETPVLLDDIVSSGATLLQATAVIRKQTSAPAVAIAIHALGDAALNTALRGAGVRLVTANTIPNPSACIDIVPLLEAGLPEDGLPHGH